MVRLIQQLRAKDVARTTNGLDAEVGQRSDGATCGSNAFEALSAKCLATEVGVGTRDRDAPATSCPVVDGDANGER